MSGGQKQRLCIAAPLLKKPKILTTTPGAVDARTLIRQRLAVHPRDEAKIIIAQRVASVQDADRIVVWTAAVSTPSARTRAVNTSDITTLRLSKAGDQDAE